MFQPKGGPTTWSGRDIFPLFGGIPDTRVSWFGVSGHSSKTVALCMFSSEVNWPVYTEKNKRSGQSESLESSTSVFLGRRRVVPLFVGTSRCNRERNNGKAWVCLSAGLTLLGVQDCGQGRGGGGGGGSGPQTPPSTKTTERMKTFCSTARTMMG